MEGTGAKETVTTTNALTKIEERADRLSSALEELAQKLEPVMLASQPQTVGKDTNPDLVEMSPLLRGMTNVADRLRRTGDTINDLNVRLQL